MNATYASKTFNMRLANYIAYRLACSAVGVQSMFFDIEDVVADFSDAVAGGIVFG